MKKKKNINIFWKMLLLLFVSFNFYLIICSYISYKQKQNLTTQFFITKKEQKENNYYKSTEQYLGILEIPKINLKKGFYTINNINNTVRKGIQILDKSSMPSEEKSILVLASHSGNGKYSYFNKINKLRIDDEIFLYYNQNKYIYYINNIYEISKNGKISINYSNKPKLVLTTCSKSDKTKQLVIEAILMMVSK